MPYRDMFSQLHDGSTRVVHGPYHGAKELTPDDYQNLQKRIDRFSLLRRIVSVAVPVAVAAAVAIPAFSAAEAHYVELDRQRPIEPCAEVGLPPGSPAETTMQAAVETRCLVSNIDHVYLSGLDGGEKTISYKDRTWLAEDAGRARESVDKAIQMMGGYAAKVTGPLQETGTRLGEGYVLQTHRNSVLVPKPVVTSCDCDSHGNCDTCVEVVLEEEFRSYSWATRVDPNKIASALATSKTAIENNASFWGGAQKVAPQNSPATYDKAKFVGQVNATFQSVDGFTASKNLEQVQSTYPTFKNESGVSYVDVEPSGPGNYRVTRSVAMQAVGSNRSTNLAVKSLQETKDTLGKLEEELRTDKSLSVGDLGDTSAEIYQAAGFPGGENHMTQSQRKAMALLLGGTGFAVTGAAMAGLWWKVLNWDENLPLVKDTTEEIMG